LFQAVTNVTTYETCAVSDLDKLIKETRKQIEAVKELKSCLPVQWDELDDPDEKRTLFQAIEADRYTRAENLMADRPPFAVVTAYDDKAVRLEYYEGHDALSLVYDVRAKELCGLDMPKWMESDPNAYDPAKFLKEAFGLPETLTKPILKEIHESE